MFLYTHPLKIDIEKIKITRNGNDVRVYTDTYPPQLIVMLDAEWSDSQITRLIHTAQKSALYAIEQGKEEKQKEIKRVLGV